jgi:hypothetical protein
MTTIHIRVSPWESEIEQQFCQSELRAGVQSPTRATLFWKQTNWIHPAPRASGLHRKRQCGVPSSHEERQNMQRSCSYFGADPATYKKAKSTPWEHRLQCFQLHLRQGRELFLNVHEVRHVCLCDHQGLRSRVTFRWRNPHQIRSMFLLWDILIGMVILFLEYPWGPWRPLVWWGSLEKGRGSSILFSGCPNRQINIPIERC